MANFKDLMSKPLPSAANRVEQEETPVEESAEDLTTEGEGCETPALATEDPIEDELPEMADSVEDLTDDEDEITPEDVGDLSPEDLDELENEINASDFNGFDEELGEEDLTPEEEEEADDYMAVTATSTLVKNEMNAEEKVNFAESALDVQIALNEGFITEADVQSFLEAAKPITEAEVLTEAVYNGKTKVKISLSDRIKQLFWVGVYSSARAHNDADYVKLQKVFVLKRRYKARLAQKYKAEANKRVKIYVKRLRASKSSVLSKLGDKVSQ